MLSKLKPSIGPNRAARLAAALLAMSATFAGTPVSAEPWPSRVDATYRIEFNGFDVGKFDLQASVNGPSYTVSGEARISALLGAFKWQGSTRSSGTLAGLSPRPAGYTFDFNGIGKQGAIKLGFKQGAITSISNLPQSPPQPDAVPVGPQHLKDVLDPLSAILALSRTNEANPCTKKLSVFDGAQRFDLALSFLRQQGVAETRPSGQPGVAFVCRVRYVPIAGHRMTSETRHMASSEGIEVWLRPVPSAALYVPHQISIPTAAGTAALIVERVNIVTRSEQIALTN
jgi:hypothetical protein